MATRTLKAKVRLYGEGRYFYVGATVAEEVHGSGCGIWVSGKYKDLTVKKVYCDYDGQTKTVSWSFDDSFSSKDTLYAVVKVWDKHPDYGGKCLDGDYTSFERYKPPEEELKGWFTTIETEYGSDWVYITAEARIINRTSNTYKGYVTGYVDSKTLSKYYFSRDIPPNSEVYRSVSFYLYKENIGAGQHEVKLYLYVGGKLLDTTTFYIYF